MSNASIFRLGLKLLDILELVHDSGQVYNDLKPDNLMVDMNGALPIKVGNEYEDIFKYFRIYLIDFGLASQWRNRKTGEHRRVSRSDLFQGNIYFSSVN